MKHLKNVLLIFLLLSCSLEYRYRDIKKIGVQHSNDGNFNYKKEAYNFNNDFKLKIRTIPIPEELKYLSKEGFSISISEPKWEWNTDIVVSLIKKYIRDYEMPDDTINNRPKTGFFIGKKFSGSYAADFRYLIRFMSSSEEEDSLIIVDDFKTIFEIKKVKGEPDYVFIKVPEVGTEKEISFIVHKNYFIEKIKEEAWAKNIELTQPHPDLEEKEYKEFSLFSIEKEARAKMSKGKINYEEYKKISEDIRNKLDKIKDKKIN